MRFLFLVINLSTFGFCGFFIFNCQDQGHYLDFLVCALSFLFVMASRQVSCEQPSTLDATTKVELDWSKPQDISFDQVDSAQSSAVEPLVIVDRDVTMSTVEESPEKTEELLETLVKNDVLADNQSSDKLTMPSEQKSTRTSELDKPTDVAGSENLRTEFHPLHADLQVLESVTERLKPSEELDKRALPLNTPVSIIMNRDLSEEISEEMDFPTADSSLTALHFDDLSTTALAVQSDVIPEVNESAIGPAKGEEKIEMEAREKIQPALGEELHDAETSVEGKPKESIGSDKSTIHVHSLDRDPDTVEEPHRKWSFTPDSCVLMSEDGKIPKKKIAALILDADTVHIHTTEAPGSTDHKAGRIDSTSDTGYDRTLSQQVERLETSNETRKEFDSPASLDQQELENASQPPEENTAQTLYNEPHTTQPEREGTWTTNNGPQEIQRVMEPLEHWTMNNGPREIQRRCIILERRDGLEIRQEPAAETNMPALDAVTSKPGRVVTDLSEPEVTENVEYEVGKERVETEDSERVASYAKKQSETLEIMGTLPSSPPRRKLEKETSLISEDKLEEVEYTVIEEVENTKRTIVKGETKPTPPTRQSQESEKLSVSSEVQSEEANLPAVTNQQYKHDKTQLPPAEVFPTPLKRYKDKLGEERLSPDLDAQPTPPEKRQKEKSEHQEHELEKMSKTITVEEPLVKPSPPVRPKVSQVESDSTSMLSKMEILEETLVKPTLPARTRDGRNVTNLVSNSSDLDKTRTKERAVLESLEKPTPPVRRKASADESAFITPLVSKPQGMPEDILVKPTPRTRKKDSRSVRDTTVREIDSQISKSGELEKTVTQGRAVEEPFVKPTPPVRRKGSQVSQIQEMEETLVKPTPPTRRRDSRNFSDEEIASKISSSTELEKTLTEENVLEELLIKPTPPVRRKVSSQIESVTVSALSKIQEVGENVVKSVLPARSKDDNVSDKGAIKISSSTDLEKTVTQEKALVEPLLKPTPPMRQKVSQVESNIILVESEAQESEATMLKPTPPVRRRNSSTMTNTGASRISASCDLENSTLVTPERVVEEMLVKPTPPVRRKISRAESDLSIVDESKEMEETLMKPTPPTRRRDGRNESDMVAIKISSSTDLENSVMEKKSVEEPLMKPSPPVRQKTSPPESDRSLLSKTQKMEEILVKPTPSSRKGDGGNVDETVPQQMENTISSSADLEEIVTKESADEEDLLKPTLTVGQEARQAESDISPVVCKPQEPEETLVKPTPPTRSGSEIKTKTVTEVSQSEGQESLTEPTVRENHNEVEHESIKVSSVSTEPEEALPKPTTPVDYKDTTDLDTIPIKVEEPSIQSTPPTKKIEESVEIQPMIKLKDEQPEKELCSDLGMESTERLTEIESAGLVEVTGNCMYVKDVPGIGVCSLLHDAHLHVSCMSFTKDTKRIICDEWQ